MKIECWLFSQNDIFCGHSVVILSIWFLQVHSLVASHIPRPLQGGIKTVFILSQSLRARTKAVPIFIYHFQNIPTSALGEFNCDVYCSSRWPTHRLRGDDDRWEVSLVMLKGTPSRCTLLEGYLIEDDGPATAMVEHQITVMVWCVNAQRRWGSNIITSYMYL